MHKIIFGNQEVKVSGLVVTANMFILIFLFSLFLAGCGSEEKKETNIERSASVKVFKVKKGDIASWISATGTLVPCQESRIGPKVEGRIEKIYADVGDRVKKGQPLIKLEQKTYIIAKNEAEAALKTAQSYLIKAEVNLKNIAKDYKRISSLWREKVISEQRYDKITTDYTAARAELNLAGARVKEAEASLDLAEDHLRETVIYAPFSGFVVEKHMERGEVSNWVTYLWNVLHLVDISKVKIECPIYETKLAFLRQGKKWR